MKILMLSNNVDISRGEYIGVKKKIIGQSEAFLNHGFQVDIIYKNNDKLKLIKLKNKEESDIKVVNSNDEYKKIYNLIVINKYDYLYIRYNLSNYYFLEFLKNIKMKHENIKLIIEFPTYPYDKEVEDSNLLLIDKFFRKHLYRYTDICTTCGDNEEIFSIPAIKMGNGIDLKGIKKASCKYKEDELNLIAVANISNWHGYDRLLSGLKKYYENPVKLKVHFHIVGVGKELNNLKKYTKDNNLEEYVEFYGKKVSSELDNIFEKCQVAIGCMGSHRKGIVKATPLKSREYCARAIPFIVGDEDIDFSDDFKYMLSIPSDDSPVDIESLIDFYQRVYLEEKLSDEMRDYASQYLTWDCKINKVINCIKNI